MKPVAPRLKLDENPEKPVLSNKIMAECSQVPKVLHPTKRKPAKAKKAKRSIGRPPVSPDVYEAILDRLAEGEGLWKICQAPDMPSRGTVLRKAAEDPIFRDRYARAMQLGVDAMVDEIERVARDGSSDWMTAKDGTTVIDHEHVTRSRLIVDTLKWKASKIAPKKYGDKIQTELSGVDGGAIQTTHRIEFVAPKVEG